MHENDILLHYGLTVIDKSNMGKPLRSCPMVKDFQGHLQRNYLG